MFETLKNLCTMSLALAMAAFQGGGEAGAAKVPQLPQQPISAQVLQQPESESLPIIEVVEGPEVEPCYTQNDVKMLAQVLWLEARGVSSQTEQACVVWTILNRVDAGYGETIADVVTAPNQFAYSPDAPVEEELANLAQDVLDRWSAEQNGAFDVGRVLPAGYFWYSGDGEHNWFRNEFRGGVKWDYGLESPYIS